MANFNVSDLFNPNFDALGNASNAANQQIRNTVYDMPSWISNPSEWMQPTLNNIIIPGVVYLKDYVGVKLRHQKSKAEGRDYGSIFIQGLELPDFEFEVLIRTGTEEKQWKDLVPYLLPRKNPQARDIIPVYHPILSMYQITNCVTIALESKQAIAGGPMNCRIGCVASAAVKENANKNLNNKGTGGRGPGPKYNAPDFINIKPNVSSGSARTPVSSRKPTL